MKERIGRCARLVLSREVAVVLSQYIWRWRRAAGDVAAGKSRFSLATPMIAVSIRAVASCILISASIVPLRRSETYLVHGGRVRWNHRSPGVYPPSIGTPLSAVPVAASEYATTEADEAARRWWSATDSSLESFWRIGGMYTEHVRILMS